MRAAILLGCLLFGGCAGHRCSCVDAASFCLGALVNGALDSDSPPKESTDTVEGYRKMWEWEARQVDEL
jgi:hypothetical protein